MQNLINKLNRLDACEDAIEWLETQQSPKQAWNNCERGDWLIWLVAETVDDRKWLVFTTCECVRLIWHLLPDVGKNTIEVAAAWTRGETTLEEVKQATAVAYADAAAVAYAAYAAATVAYAAATAAYAADAAYYATYAADADGEDIQRKQADIVRKNYTFDEVVKGLNNE